MNETATTAPASPPPPLPVRGGPSRAVLMLVHPRLLFLHWVVDDALRARLARASAPVEAVIEAADGSGAFREVERRPFDFRAPSWYLRNDRLDIVLRVRIGFGGRRGFEILLTSNPLRIPRQAAGTGPLVESRRPAVIEGSPSGRISWGRPPAALKEEREPLPQEIGRFALVLHAHLPFIRHPEREYFQEEHWLFEAITETYLPLLDAFDHLVRDRVPARLTMSLTPTLLAMFRDPVLCGKYSRHLERQCDLAEREAARTRRDPDFAPVTGFYRDRLERLRHLYHREYGRDLVARFAAHEEAGLLEIIGCAATHGFLPHLSHVPETARAQVEVGVREHLRQIGRPPRGLWIPECAYFEGLDAILAQAGIEYAFLDTRAIRNASSRPRHDVYAPIHSPAGVAFFGRDEECSVQVWSSKEGYPGDPSYRDFYRDIGFDLDFAYVAPYLDPAGTRGMTGFKYYRITGETDDKQPYRRDWALRTADRHAADFVARRREQVERLGPAMDRTPLIVAMFDAELFGHWWFEGPEWLEGILRRLRRQGISAVTAPDDLARHPEGQVAEPSASSWGAGGYHEVWLNGTNDWIQPPLEDAGRRMTVLVSRFGADGPPSDPARRALRQAGRELLLAQSSDWPFILHGWTTVGYARRRVHDHLHRFDRLARQIEAGGIDEAFLAECEARDNLFPDLDPRAWRSA